MKYQHFLCPLLSIGSFLLVDSFQELVDKTTLRLALIPTVFYAIAAVIGNITKVIYGPYPFLHVYEQSVYMSIFWTVIIVGMAYFISFGFTKINNKLYGKKLFPISYKSKKL